MEAITADALRTLGIPENHHAELMRECTDIHDAEDYYTDVIQLNEQHPPEQHWR